MCSSQQQQPQKISTKIAFVSVTLRLSVKNIYEKKTGFQQT